MVQSLKSILTEYGIDGDIILYRDTEHKKKGLCEFIAQTILMDKEVVTYSDGAFGLYLARALPSHTVHTCYSTISPDYGELMQAQTNLILHANMRRATDYQKFVSEHPELHQVNQYTDDLVWQYYKQHFIDVVNEVKELKIDAFCDYSHSGATLRGFVESNLENKLVNWTFVLGSIDVFIQIGKQPYFRNHTQTIKDKLKYAFCCWLNTFDLGEKIEQAFPSFGNVYEATRSIAGAMSYLKEYPGRTVLVYVGDNYVKEGTKFRKGSRSIVGTTESVLLNDFTESINQNKIMPREKFVQYYNLFKDSVGDEYKQYIFSTFMKILAQYHLIHKRSVSGLNFIKFAEIIQSINPEIKKSTLDLLRAVLFGEAFEVDTALKSEWDNKGNMLLIRVIAKEFSSKVFDTNLYNILDKKVIEVDKLFRGAGAINL